MTNERIVKLFPNLLCWVLTQLDINKFSDPRYILEDIGFTDEEIDELIGFLNVEDE